MIRKTITLLGLICTCMIFFAVFTMADEADITVTGSDGYSCSFMLDDDYTTADYYMEGDYLQVSSDTELDALYIMWDTEPGSWTLTVEGREYTYGKNGYLHEFVQLPVSSKEVRITIGKDRTYIDELRAYSGSIPASVQKWEDPYDEADFLAVSTHSDDEVLFLGGAITIAVDQGYRVQVAYYCDFYQTEHYRQHEQLDGLWEMGVTHYPQFGRYMDEYSTDLDTAKSQVDYDEVVGYMVETIRRFRPQVVLSQDFEGEYGHGQHRLVAAAISDALEQTADGTRFPDSASKYGTWDVPKTYYHLYGENQITLDVRTPLEHFGGRNALQVAQDAYKKHRSQQWMWFHVSDGIDDEVPPPDGYEYSPVNKFGLYRTLVGADTGNDMMEHLMSYDSKAREIETNDPSQTEETAGASETTPEGGNAPGQNTQKGGSGILKTILIIIGVIALICVIVIIILLIISAKRKKKREEERRRRLAAKRRAQAAREADRTERTPSGSGSGRVTQVKDIK